MALIKCPECGTEFSEFAKECPKCACPVEIAKKATVEGINERTEKETPLPNNGNNRICNAKESIKQEKNTSRNTNAMNDAKIEKIRAIGSCVIIILILLGLCSPLIRCNSNIASEEIEIKDDSIFNEDDTVFILNNKKLEVEMLTSSCYIGSMSFLSEEECKQLEKHLGPDKSLQVYYDTIDVHAKWYKNRRTIYYYRYDCKNSYQDEYRSYYPSLADASRAYIDSIKNRESETFIYEQYVSPQFDEEIASLKPLMEKREKKKEQERAIEEAKNLNEEKQDFLKRLKSACWEEDVDVSWYGTTITFTGYQFARNKNIQYFQTKIQSDLKKYGFKRVIYKWSRSSDYYYYDI